MDEQKFLFLEALLDAIQQDDLRMNDWERSFSGDMVKRFEKYGRDTYVSEKQWNAIKKIADLYDLSVDQF